MHHLPTKFPGTTIVRRVDMHGCISRYLYRYVLSVSLSAISGHLSVSVTGRRNAAIDTAMRCDGTPLNMHYAYLDIEASFPCLKLARVAN